jgi:glutamine synthetase
MEKFSHGIGHRGCSVRINKQVHYDGKGYLEDRRPASNLDPYKVLRQILKCVAEE